MVVLDEEGGERARWESQRRGRGGNGNGTLFLNGKSPNTVLSRAVCERPNEVLLLSRYRNIRIFPGLQRATTGDNHEYIIFPCT